MNSIEKLDPHLLGMPSEKWNNVFGGLSYRKVFFNFPQVSTASADLKSLCYEGKHIAQCY